MQYYICIHEQISICNTRIAHLHQNYRFTGLALQRQPSADSVTEKENNERQLQQNTNCLRCRFIKIVDIIIIRLYIYL